MRSPNEIKNKIDKLKLKRIRISLKFTKYENNFKFCKTCGVLKNWNFFISPRVLGYPYSNCRDCQHIINTTNYHNNRIAYKRKLIIKRKERKILEK